MYIASDLSPTQRICYCGHRVKYAHASDGTCLENRLTKEAIPSCERRHVASKSTHVIMLSRQSIVLLGDLPPLHLTAVKQPLYRAAPQVALKSPTLLSSMRRACRVVKATTLALHIVSISHEPGTADAEQCLRHRQPVSTYSSVFVEE